MKEAPMPSPDRLMTDRSSYISYLEAQLERVSAACLTVQSFDERLEQAVGGIRALEEKVLSLARLVSCTQQFAEAQEAAQREAAGDAARRLRALEARVEAFEATPAEWEAKLRAVSAKADARLAAAEAAAEARLADAAAELQSGLEEACHASHTALERKAGEASGRLTEAERRLRALDEYVHAHDAGAAVGDLSARLGSVEASVAHLAASDAGMKSSLGGLQNLVGQLKTAVVALELRPPLAGPDGGGDCLQWLERAREALRREVADIQQQHGQLAAGLTSAVAVAAAAPAASPQKALAVQLLSGLQSSMQHEVGKELKALQMADSLLKNVSKQFRNSPPRASPPRGAAPAAGDAQAAGSASEGQGVAAAAGGGGDTAADTGAAGWTIAAYPPAPSSQQAVLAAAGDAMAQLAQLAGGEAQLAQAAALAAGAGGGGSSSLRGTFGQMQAMLQSVCQLLAPEEGQERRRPSEPGYRAPTTSFLSRSNTLQRSSPPGAVGQPKRSWLPGGASKAGGAAAAAAAAADVGRSVSFRPGSAGAALGGRGGTAAARSLLFGVGGSSGEALADRRRRLQQLYAELRQQ
ncbi:Chromatin structure-remodeling complex BSH [Micractinium conductrix]|uniref:Chromatin structure-remodeling complex BSH n=1 Tax=Micractinium conductrix TaxID=554055 RepID=A0A2P6VLH7_9CHLO|nr:Chromatin structure-remodeling complex BSH [Micractinium conductrix]|eukprot:PSC74920.1 Chromatin structure-remodeling complex BSH [Micractinium conductrix]